LKWIEANHRVLSMAVAAAGILLWTVHRMLGIPIPWWRENFSESVADFVGILGFLFEIVLAPILALGLIALSIYLVKVGPRRSERDRLSFALCLMGVVLPMLFLAYLALGFVLLATLDF
jgi:uncharacterized Tic20 family protein